MPISSLANTNGKSNSNSRRRKMKTKKIPKPNQGDKFSHSILLRNRLVREYLSRFSQQKWNEAIKYAVVAGIQSFLIMEHEQNDGVVGLTLDDLEQQILRGKAAIAMKKNLKKVNEALQTVKDDVATMEDSIQVDTSGTIVDEQPLAGRRLAKFPFVDERGGVANVLVQHEVPIPSKENLTSENAQSVVTRILSESNRNSVGVQLNKNGMKKRDENRNPIYPGWWPDDHVTEATNRARGMPKPKAKQRVGPRLSYSLKGANENENILTNDLVTEAYIDVPSSGYRAGYKPLKGTKRSQIVQKQKEEFASKRAMDISTKPFTVKERVLMNRRSNSSGNNNNNNNADDDDNNKSSADAEERQIPNYLKNVPSKVKAQVNAYKKAIRKAKQEQKEVMEEIMSPARAPLPGRDYNITHNNRPYMSNDNNNNSSMDRIADAFLDEYNDLVEDGPSPRNVNLDPWGDADVYVPVKSRKGGKFNNNSKSANSSIIMDIEKSYNESEFRSRRFRPTYQGWVGDYGAPHTRRGNVGNTYEDDGYYVDGDMMEDAITKEKTDEILKRNSKDDESSLNINNFLLPVPPNQDSNLTIIDDNKKSKANVVDVADGKDNGRIGDPIVLPVDLTMENETVDDTIARSKKTIQEINQVESESQMKILEMEDAMKRTEGMFF